MQILHYTKVQDLEQAWQLAQKRGAVVLGGCGWLRLSPQRRMTEAIDLSGLGLDAIAEDEQAFTIGAMVTLRQLEQSASLAAYTQGAMKEALRHIVGTQFRNTATVGGSLCGRFGFSDVLTLFLALDARVVLFKGGEMSLEDFAKNGVGTDILTKIIVPKQCSRTAYASIRLNATDFPIIACALSVTPDGGRFAVGARPMRAEVLPLSKGQLAPSAWDQTAQAAADFFTYESNMRGSAAYRHDMAAVLCRRLLAQTGGDRP